MDPSLTDPGKKPEVHWLVPGTIGLATRMQDGERKTPTPAFDVESDTCPVGGRTVSELAKVKLQVEATPTWVEDGLQVAVDVTGMGESPQPISVDAQKNSADTPVTA